VSRNLHWKESDLKNQNNGTKPKKLSKYRNTKVEYDGMKFDSIKEKNYYIELKLRQKAGEIAKIECQVPIYYWSLYETENKDKGFAKRYAYIADFKITYPDGHFEIIDVKGDKKHLTREFKHKRMIIEKLYNVKIKIV